MKIKKFPQNCLLVTANKTRLLVDPGGIKYDNTFLKDWQKADAVLITHRHGDHIKPDVLKTFNASKPIYSTQEVADANLDLVFRIVKADETFFIGDVKIEVVRAVHGYNPRLKPLNAEVHENVGFIIDDGKTRLYITGDTICFNNDYKADYVFAPVTGYGLTMTPFETALFTKECGARKLIVSHLDNETYQSDLKLVEKTLKEQGIDYIIPSIGEEIELENKNKKGELKK